MKAKLFFIIFTFICLGVNAQSYLGAGFEINRYKLYNISTDTITPYGYSGAKIEQVYSKQVCPNILFNKVIHPLFELQTGIGYNYYAHNLGIDYYSLFFHKKVNTVLNIRLNYISVPMSLKYYTTKRMRYNIGIEAGITPRFLIKHSDNYQKIILEEIAWINPKWYSKINSTIKLGIVASHLVAKNDKIAFGFFVQKDLLPFVKKDKWGLYENLFYSRNHYVGISINYFFNTNQ